MMAVQTAEKILVPPGSVFAGHTGSELAYMYYTVLGNTSIIDIYGNTVAFQYHSFGPFIHLGVSELWSESTYLPNSNTAWFMSYDYGEQIPVLKTYNQGRAWLTRGGDSGVPIVAIPETSSKILILVGLIIIFIRLQTQKHAP